MSGFNPGRRPGRKTIITEGIMIFLALVIVALTIVVFILREQYDILIPGIFVLGVLMNGIHTYHYLSLDENRRRNIPGAVFSLLMAVVLLGAAVISGIVLWK